MGGGVEPVPYHTYKDYTKNDGIIRECVKVNQIYFFLNRP